MTETDNKGNFTEGPIFTRLFLFAVPLMISGLLQVFYNMADSIIVGRFSSDPTALAAVGSTSIFNNLIITFLLGFSGGAGVIVAQHFGARDKERVSKSIHTSMTIALISGVAFAVLGFVFTRGVLTLMSTKPELMDGATLYMHIICIGIPANVIYNFGASVLRSVGDSKSSLYILAMSGILNVALNLLFVVAFDMTVDGVALATVLSQYLSAILVIVVMVRRSGETKYYPTRLIIDRGVFKSIVRLGLPAGFCNSLFALSNMVITSAFNSFSTEVIYARTVVQNVDTMVTTLITSYQRSTTTFVAQNYGAAKLPRIKKTLLYSVIQMLIIVTLSSQLILAFARPIASLYIGLDNPNREVILDHALPFFRILLNTYFICGLFNVLEGALRGIKYSLSPTLISFFTIIGIRLLWVYFIFPYEPFNTANWLMASFPISWAFAVLAYIVLILIAFRLLKKKFKKKTLDNNTF